MAEGRLAEVQPGRGAGDAALGHQRVKGLQHRASPTLRELAGRCAASSDRAFCLSASSYPRCSNPPLGKITNPSKGRPRWRAHLITSKPAVSLLRLQSLNFETVLLPQCPAQRRQGRRRIGSASPTHIGDAYFISGMSMTQIFSFSKRAGQGLNMQLDHTARHGG